MTGTYGTKRDEFTISFPDFGDVKDEGPNGPVPTSRPRVAQDSPSKPQLCNWLTGTMKHMRATSKGRGAP
jgi:hypothetical protein